MLRLFSTSFGCPLPAVSFLSVTLRGKDDWDCFVFYATFSEIYELRVANLPECLWPWLSTLCNFLALFGEPDPPEFLS